MEIKLFTLKFGLLFLVPVVFNRVSHKPLRGFSRSTCRPNNMEVRLSQL
jgi:hypothetical protein